MLLTIHICAYTSETAKGNKPSINAKTENIFPSSSFGTQKDSIALVIDEAYPPRISIIAPTFDNDITKTFSTYYIYV